VNTRAQAPVDAITLRITSVRGQRVLLDSDLAALDGVETKRLNEAVKRNQARFPADFMVALSQEEWDRLRSQIATLDAGRGQHRKRAVDVSVYVVRAFVRLRELAAAHGDMAKRIRRSEGRRPQGIEPARPTHHGLSIMVSAASTLWPHAGTYSTRPHARAKSR
jgi:hypothetical protein